MNAFFPNGAGVSLLRAATDRPGGPRLPIRYCHTARALTPARFAVTATSFSSARISGILQLLRGMNGASGATP